MSFSSKSIRLSPATIIPPELYIERNADRQLAANVAEMGRPAYILVARQMGKTNLLLHAKRTLETNETKFVYVDLSVAAYTDERECFRHIIDVAMDSHFDVFGDLEEIIKEKRKESRPPTREHDLELRLLLSNQNRKIVIILDEIDSLVHASFSDRVFAHIRSVYFSRINYPELGRLGYILSGVVEPNEIIKDKKISPFNIGEKIYLDDFSVPEIELFLSRAGLTISKQGLERLIYWTGGNPRILWDLCSELERKANCDIVDDKLIDDTVFSYYLNDFDHAPVDHIRELVRENADIRSNVWSLVESSSTVISDSARTKLYLYGIIRTNSSQARPVIKNEIIARALSIEWLKGLVIDRRSLFSQAQDQYSRKRFDSALEGYLEYLQGASEGDTLISLTRYQIGCCYSNMGMHSNALTYFLDVPTLGNNDLDSKKKMLMGVCYLYLDRPDESIDELRNALKDVHDESIRCHIQLNLGGALLHRRSSEDLDEALTIFNVLRSSLKNIPANTEDSPSKNTLETAVYYNLGSVYQHKNDLLLAAEALNSALQVADSFSLPAIYIQLAEVTEDKSQCCQYLEESLNVCIQLNLYPVTYDPDRPLVLTEVRVLDLIVLFAEQKLNNELQKFLRHLATQLPRVKNSFSWLSSAGRHAVLSKKREVGACLFRTALTESNVDSVDRHECISWLLLVDNDEMLEQEFITLLNSKDLPYQLSFIDVASLAKIVKSRYIKLDWLSALDVVRTTSKFRDSIDPSLLKNYLGFDAIELMCLDNLGRLDELPSLGKRTMALWNHLQNQEDRGQIFFHEGDISSIPTLIDSLTNRNVRVDFPLVGNDLSGYTRNMKVSVKYTNGRLIHGIKFKKIEEDLRAGICSIIN